MLSWGSGSNQRLNITQALLEEQEDRHGMEEAKWNMRNPRAGQPLPLPTSSTCDKNTLPPHTRHLPTDLLAAAQQTRLLPCSQRQDSSIFRAPKVQKAELSSNPSPRHTPMAMGSPEILPGTKRAQAKHRGGQSNNRLQLLTAAHIKPTREARNQEWHETKPPLAATKSNG